MDKKVIKLTESELNEIVKESVAKIVKEASYDDKGNFIQSQHNDDLRVRFESELEKVNKFINDEMMTLSNIATSAMDEEIKKSGIDVYFVDHTAGVYPTAASGFPWSAASIGVKGDPISDLNEDMGAEQKARVTYDNILRLSDDPDVNDVIKYLREREIVHYQRFGEALRLTLEKQDQKNVYAMNPSFP